MEEVQSKLTIEAKLFGRDSVYDDSLPVRQVGEVRSAVR
jgi:hypothetical protein